MTYTVISIPPTRIIAHIIDRRKLVTEKWMKVQPESLSKVTNSNLNNVEYSLSFGGLITGMYLS